MRVFPLKPAVGHQGVSVECRACFHVFANLGLKGFLPSVGNDHGTDFTAPFHDSEDRSFVFAASASNAALAFGDMHIAGLAADEGLIRFDVAAGFLDGTIMQSHANAVIQKPRRLLGDSEIAGHFAGANAILAIDDEPERCKPLVETDRRVLHQGASL